MTKLHAEPIDIRFLSAITPLVGFALMIASFVAPGLVMRVYGHWFGSFGFLVHALLVFAILRFNYVPCLWMVRLFYRKVLSQASDHVVVEIERLDTYHKLKLVPDDLGVLFCQDGDVYLRRNRSLYVMGESAKPKNLRIYRHKGRPRGLVWHDEITRTDFVLRPVIFLWDFTFYGDFKRRVDILVMTLMRWTRDGTPPTEMPRPDRSASPAAVALESASPSDRTPYAAPDSFR
ncbi:MAG TPA: hypothetical protein PKO15_08350 [Fibrobacteria bacterium]|nr:hypothetical protein [Fibrobacteria bacterium]HOX52463.1 hypothetical protein [Fibrobacteria bacterium]